MTQKNKEIPLSKRFFPGLLPIIGVEKYNKVIERYRDIYSNHEFPSNPRLRWHLIEGILPGLALYQVLRESETQENALKNIDNAFERLFSNTVKKMKKIGSIPFIYYLLRFFIKSALLSYPPEGWEIEWKQNDKNAIRFNMKSCFYYDTLSKYCASELTASFCRVDDLIYENMSPYLLWQRTMTIARGNAYCDFCFEHKKS
ncbi:MAG: L-2-amino-thiazoline-4-carboxylic acid hydrolase [Bacteroidia bacterium]|nr:L-2-amino-thiazoline-4-carboxylic acid hydrolase [Bacteroidia bacterium]